MEDFPWNRSNPFVRLNIILVLCNQRQNYICWFLLKVTKG